LGNDEAYYFTYAEHLQWNYFDHPPGVAVLIKLTTVNLLLTGELFVRLGAIFCAVLGSLLCYKTGNLIQNERTGFYAAVLYNTSIYTSIIAGTFILPDSPQIIFLLASLYVLLEIILLFEKNNKISIFHWLLFGLSSGVCIMCKVHGIFLWFGLGLYILFFQRKMFSLPGLYLSLVLMLTITSPIIIWNIHNHFITWTFHSKRIAVERSHLSFINFFLALTGQIFYNNAINVFLIAVSVIDLQKNNFLQSASGRVLLLTGLPIILIVSCIALFNPVLPHWSGPGFLVLSFIAAAYLDNKTKEGSILRAYLKSSALFILITIAGGIILIKYYPGTLSNKIQNTGEGDFTLDLSGWRSFEKEYSIWMQKPNNKKYSHLKIVCNKWFPAAHLEYYIARPENTGVVGVGSLTDLHNFVWLNHDGRDLTTGEDALTIVPSNYNIDAPKAYTNYFTTVKILQAFIQKRNGKTSRYFYLYLLKNYKGNDEAHKISKLNQPFKKPALGLEYYGSI